MYLKEPSAFIDDEHSRECTMFHFGIYRHSSTHDQLHKGVLCTANGTQHPLVGGTQHPLLHAPRQTHHATSSVTFHPSLHSDSRRGFPVRGKTRAASTVTSTCSPTVVLHPDLSHIRFRPHVPKAFLSMSRNSRSRRLRFRARRMQVCTLVIIDDFVGGPVRT